METQTAHDDVYFIIGEEHRLSEGGTRYETVWTLEPAADADWMVIAKEDENGDPIPGTGSPLNQGVLAY
ncbi:MAG: hypothetical protein L6Q98_21305 [Anaerolineae bacterium]|nr:hypothetical protein [Anaerolineae bacterium]NUQ06126.1 hypothetical protein [Anaerolineae bacterium]